MRPGNRGLTIDKPIPVDGSDGWEVWNETKVIQKLYKHSFMKCVGCSSILLCLLSLTSRIIKNDAINYAINIKISISGIDGIWICNPDQPLLAGPAHGSPNSRQLHDLRRSYTYRVLGNLQSWRFYELRLEMKIAFLTDCHALISSLSGGLNNNQNHIREAKLGRVDNVPTKSLAFNMTHEWWAGGKYVTSSTLGLFQLLSDPKPSGMSF